MEKVEKGAILLNNKMSQRSKTWLLLILLPILVIAVVLAMIWAATKFWYLQFLLHPRHPYIIILGDIELFYIAKTVFSTINMVLLIILLTVYVDIYRKTRSEFTIGLIIFSVILFLYALTSNPMVMLAFGFRPFGLGPFALLPELFTFAALIVLLYLSVRY
ncbi:MAG: hypothetical protein LZ163_05745 [Thaumarchaeota archaeon]|nr:hypothetical protein [Candidatus Terraquivivens yellowstonensis]